MEAGRHGEKQYKSPQAGDSDLASFEVSETVGEKSMFLESEGLSKCQVPPAMSPNL